MDGPDVPGHHGKTVVMYSSTGVTSSRAMMARIQRGVIMPSRRTFLSLLAGSAVAPDLTFSQGRLRRLALYANVGPVLTHYDVDLAKAELVKRDSVTLPAGVQYCWPHRNQRYFYVASSDSAAGNVQIGTTHHVTAFRIDPTTDATSAFRCAALRSVRRTPG